MHLARRGDLLHPVSCFAVSADVSLGSIVESDAKGVHHANPERAIKRIAREVKKLLKAVPKVKLAFENMVRSYTDAKCDIKDNWSLRELKRVIDNVGDKRAMVCVDMCHAYIGDHDLRDFEGVQAMQADLAAIGYDRIACMHVSDSWRPHGQTCDGHAR